MPQACVMLPQTSGDPKVHGEACMQVRVNPELDGPDIAFVSTPIDDVLLIRRGAVPRAIVLQLGVALADAKVCRHVLLAAAHEGAAVAS